MSDNVFTSIMKVIWVVAFFTFFFSVSLPFVAEYISGDEILSDTIGPSKDIEANIMLIENDKVTIVFKTNEVISNAELLNISLVDPQKKEFFWGKSFAPSDEPSSTTIDFFSFIPESSGMYRIKINNADFQTEIKIVSGMITPSKQPAYFPLLIISFIVVFAGVFFSKSIRRGFNIFSLCDALIFIISLSLSLIIIYTTIVL